MGQQRSEKPYEPSVFGATLPTPTLDFNAKLFVFGPVEGGRHSVPRFG